jgi:hypothetical protein
MKLSNAARILAVALAVYIVCDVLRRPVSAGVLRRAGWSLFGPSTAYRHPTGGMGASRRCRHRHWPRLLVAQIADRQSGGVIYETYLVGRAPLLAVAGLLRGLFHLALEPGRTVRRGESEGLMQTGHSSGNFAVADAEIAGNSLVGQIALDQAKQLQLGTLQTASQLSVRETMYPGCSCHSH